MIGKSDSDVINTHDDLEMLRRPHLWPNQSKFGKWLCLKRRDLTAFARITEIDPLTLHIFDPPHLTSNRQTSYDRLEDILADGWVVD